MAARIVSTSFVLFLFINKLDASFSDYLPDYEADSETELSEKQKPDKLPEILPVCYRWGITDPDNEDSDTPNIKTSPCPENIARGVALNLKNRIQKNPENPKKKVLKSQ